MPRRKIRQHCVRAAGIILMRPHLYKDAIYQVEHKHWQCVLYANCSLTHSLSAAIVTLPGRISICIMWHVTLSARSLSVITISAPPPHHAIFETQISSLNKADKKRKMKLGLTVVYKHCFTSIQITNFPN